MRAQYRVAAWQAWHSAYMQRCTPGHFPKLDTMLKSFDDSVAKPVKPLNDEDMTQALDRLFVGLGGVEKK